MNGQLTRIILGICLPTRNRVEALQESIASFIFARRATLCSSKNVDLKLFIRNNGAKCCYHDAVLNNKLVSLTSDEIQSISYKFNEEELYMNENWEKNIEDALNTDVTHVMVLADRRLLTPKVIDLIDIIRQSNAEIVVFDHQSWWLSANHLVKLELMI